MLKNNFLLFIPNNRISRKNYNINGGVLFWLVTLKLTNKQNLNQENYHITKVEIYDTIYLSFHSITYIIVNDKKNKISTI